MKRGKLCPAITKPKKPLKSGSKAKKRKPLETSLRQALRQVWLRSASRYAILKAARKAPALYECAACRKLFRVEEIHVDHNPGLGSFTMLTVGEWINNLFFGHQEVLCRPCHKEKK